MNQTISPTRLAEIAARYRASRAPAPPHTLLPSPNIAPPSEAVPVDHRTSKPTMDLAEYAYNEPNTVGFTRIPKPTQPANILVLNPEAEEQNSKLSYGTDRFGAQITYNEKQSEAIRIGGLEARSCVIVGAAGTGKTTVMKAVLSALSQHPKSTSLHEHTHKHLPQNGTGIIICAFTRRATNNIRKNLDESFRSNCITIHKSLEYEPVYYEVLDENGESKRKMEFQPTRGRDNPFPEGVFAVVYEESSMVSVALYEEMRAAYPHKNMIEIFLGDIQQLPPVFGSAILGFKMLELPVIELTEVYRQALDSPIIRLAHRILSGRTIQEKELRDDWQIPRQLRVIPWKKQISSEAAANVTYQMFKKLYAEGEYDPLEHIILIPFNKAYGTLDLNRSIANEIAKKEKKVVYEVIAGFIKHYFSVGDKVLFDREDAVILDIQENPTYTGALPQTASEYLDYWGHDATPSSKIKQESSDDHVDFILAQVSKGEGEDRVTQASHKIRILLQDSGLEKEVSTAAGVNSMILGYALTIHKSQGSEWDKVFILWHNSHNMMINREAIYTAVTRAKKELIIVCEGDTFIKGIERQRIRGDSIEAKAEYFKGKLEGETL